MDVCLVIKERLEQLGLEQKDLAAAAEVTESYVSQLLTPKKQPPAPDRTDIYEKMGKVLKMSSGKLTKLAELQRREELKRNFQDPPAPLASQDLSSLHQQARRGCAGAPFRCVQLCCHRAEWQLWGFEFKRSNVAKWPIAEITDRQLRDTWGGCKVCETRPSSTYLVRSSETSNANACGRGSMRSPTCRTPSRMSGRRGPGGAFSASFLLEADRGFRKHQHQPSRAL